MRDSSQFGDSRPTPISVPSIVASTTPTTASFSVFNTPMSSARP